MSKNLKVNRETLTKASKRGLIQSDQIDDLLSFIIEENKQQGKETSIFSLLLYYFGGFISILSITLFMTLTLDNFGKEGLLIFTGILFISSLLFESRLSKKGYYRAAGVMVTFALCLVPLAVFLIQSLIGMYDTILGEDYTKYHEVISGKWIFIEFVTLFVGAILLWKYKYPFIMFPVTITLWYLSMDLVVLFIGDDYYSYDIRRQFSLYFGICLTLFGIYIDYRSNRNKDFSYWLYLVGVASFWFGMTLNDSDSELAKFIYFLINFAMLVLGSLLLRKVFWLFGSIGSIIYFAHLSDLFRDVFSFTLFSIACGFSFIYFGVWWNKNGHKINDKLLSLLSEKTKIKIKEIHK